MTMHEMHYFFARRSVRRGVRTTAGLIGIAVLGYVAITFVGHARSSLDVSSGFAPERQMATPAAPAAMADSQSARGVASASERAAPPATAPTPEVDYFPNRYVNQATTIEEPSPTF